MLIKQISAFIENKPGRLAEVTKYLADDNINIHAISIADTTDFGILRLIVSDPDKAKKTLKDKSLTVKTTEVIAVALEHRPGSLADILSSLAKNDISIEYMYAFTSRSLEHDAMVILRLNNQQESIEKLLKESSIKILDCNILDKLDSSEYS